MSDGYPETGFSEPRDGSASDGPAPAASGDEVRTERGTVRVNGVETYYERRGDGPPVVFVHAALVDHTMWDPQIEALAGAYTTIVYDVRGHGRTGGSAVDPYSIELFADDLAALLTALGVARPVLCGASMGGAIAQVYAARYPEAVAGLVLADTFTPAKTDWRDRFVPLLLQAQIPPVRLFGLARVQRAGAWLHERFNEGAAGEYGTIEQLQAEMPPIPYPEFAKIVRSLVAFTRSSVDLSSISVPTLVLYGENTLGYVRRQAALLGTGIPDASVREVPDGGHACSLDNPGFFSSALGEFLAEVTERTDD